MELGFLSLSLLPKHKGHSMLNTFRGIFDRAIDRAINEAGVDALKRTSLFGSNDPAAIKNEGMAKAA